MKVEQQTESKIILNYLNYTQYSMCACVTLFKGQKRLVEWRSSSPSKNV